jgi:hypothetical protein
MLMPKEDNVIIDQAKLDKFVQKVIDKLGATMKSALVFIAISLVFTIFKDTHLVKLELLSNVTIIDSALSYMETSNKSSIKE